MNNDFITSENLTVCTTDEEEGGVQDTTETREPEENKEPKSKYIYTEKRQENLRKAREKKRQMKMELTRLKEKENQENIEKTLIINEKPKKTKKKIIIYDSASDSYDEEPKIIVRKKNLPTPRQEPKYITPSTGVVTPHDVFIRNILNGF